MLNTASIPASIVMSRPIRRFDLGVVLYRVPVAGAFSANPLISRNITLPLVVAYAPELRQLTSICAVVPPMSRQAREDPCVLHHSSVRLTLYSSRLLPRTIDTVTVLEDRGGAATAGGGGGGAGGGGAAARRGRSRPRSRSVTRRTESAFTSPG